MLKMNLAEAVVSLTLLETFIYEHFHNDTIVIISSNFKNWDSDLDNIPKLIHPKFFLTPWTPQNTSEIKLFKNYIIVENDQDDVITSITSLKDNLNSRGRFLVIFQKLPTDDGLRNTFETLWSHYIYNVVIYTKFTNFTTWYPYQNCGRLTSLVTKVKPPHWFDGKIPKDLGGCPVNVTWAKKRLIMNNPAEKNNPGVAFECLNAIARRNNVSIIYLKDNLDYINLAVRHLNHSKLHHDMLKRKIDMAISVGKVGKVIGQGFEATWFFCKGFCYVILPPRCQVTKHTKILDVFSNGIWFTIATSVFTIAISWRILTKLDVFEIVRLLLQGILLDKPKTTFLRLLFLLLIVYVMSLYWFYLSQLSTGLISPACEPKIRTLQELVESNKIMKIPVFYMHKLKKLNHELYLKFLKRRTTEVSKESDLTDFKTVENFIDNLDYGTVFEDITLRFFRNPQKLERLIDSQICALGWGFNVRQGFPLLERFNWAILHVREAGLVDKWYQDAVTVAKKMVIPDRNEYVPVALTINYISGSISIWCGGVVLSVFILICEIHWKKIRVLLM